MSRLRKIIKPFAPTFVVIAWRIWNAYGRFPRLVRPRRHSDWILRRAGFDRRPLLRRLTDKATVRGYVEERLGPDLLPRLYVLTRDPATIDFDALPDCFVIKPTHASGSVRIVRDKATLDCAELIAQCRQWLRRDYYRESMEWAYKGITPQIMVEEFIDDGTGGAPTDYKVFVYHGRVALIQADFDRFVSHRRRVFDRSWNRLGFDLQFPDIGRDVKAPPHLREMVAAAETLGRGLNFIRIDFYDTDRKLYFGEMAVYPGGTREVFYPVEVDEHYGSLWRSPER
jgi:hypothetical protein